VVDNIRADSVAWVRERFLQAEEVPPDRLRAGIVESWRRSQLYAVDSAGLDPPFIGDLDTDGPLMRAAQPVLDRLAETLSDARVGLFVTDASGRVLHRRVLDRAFMRGLDEIMLAPGFCYAEEHVGTNGIGTALETGRVSFVSGSEHFNERLHPGACAGAPIRDPLTGRLVGLLNISCWHKDAGPLVPALAHNAASAVEQRLVELGSERERAIMCEFLSIGRKFGRPAITVGDGLTMANRPAADLLAPADHSIVHDRAADLLRAGELSGQVTLSDGEAATLRCHPVGTYAGTAVVEINLIEARRPAPRPVISPAELGLAGSSTSFRKVCADLMTRCQAGTWTLVEGEPGAGKLALAEAAHHARDREAPLVMIGPGDRTEDATARLDQASSNGSARRTVVLRHPERFTPAALAAVTAWMDSQSGHPDRPWLVATASMGAELPDDLLRALPVTLTVPPLRYRLDDVRELVPHLLRGLNAHPSVSCGPAAMRILLRSRWPGNIAELAQVLRHVLTRTRAGRIRPEDLPASCHAVSRHVLTPWETLERDAIVHALLETNGDKAEAADMLGISRATIYRKINTYGISVTLR
jgi:sigma-54 dependent transcriptional regulator, acetoin dehydrogenase operon transcriptional activator AcoR